MKMLLLLVASLLFARAGLVAAQPSVCGGTGPYAEAQLARIRALVTGTSTDADSLRASQSLLPTSSDSVVLVTDDSLCAAASQALRQTLGRLDAPVARIWVIQIGASRYWVYDPRFRNSDEIVHAVFDTAWTNLSLISG